MEGTVSKEFGVFDDEGCIERGLYGQADVDEAKSRYEPEDEVELLEMCGCDSSCECAYGSCDCGDDIGE
jgi:hypothetical protein